MFQVQVVKEQVEGVRALMLILSTGQAVVSTQKLSAGSQRPKQEIPF